MSKFAMVGARSGELLTFRGKALIHNSRPEMEFLFPNSRVIRVTDGDLKQPWMWLRDHPGMTPVQWPLRREDFVDAK